jgi:MFS transporter, MHS family, alpha-ketoglutarate permease
MNVMATITPPVRGPDVRARLRSIVGGSAGNMVEWYDWYVYAMFMVYFARVFFPSGNQTAELLSAAAVLALGFQMRPIGAWVMGIYADRKGRKAGLTLSITMMCTGSFLIAIAPGYETIGILAPALLVFARLLQGIGIGGEYGIGAVYLSEMAERGRRGFYSSFQYVALVSGQLIASVLLLVLQVLLTHSQLSDWGWRIPFAIEGALSIAVLYIRRGLLETQSFEKVTADRNLKSSCVDLFRDHPKAALTVLALTAGGTLAFYAYTTYLPKFLVNTSGFSRESATQITAAAVFVFMVCQPLAGVLSDRIGHKPLMIGFGILGVLLTCAIFSTLATTTGAYAAFALSLAGLLIVTGYTSTNSVVIAEMFPAHIRSLGVALPYAVANTIVGGTAEWVALKFEQMGHESWFAWYVTILIGLSLTVYIGTRGTRDHGVIQEN